MLKIEVDDEGRATIIHQDDPIDTAVEISMAITAIYNSFVGTDPMIADVFRKSIRTLVNLEESPMWGPIEGVTAITKVEATDGSEQKGGAPTGQS